MPDIKIDANRPLDKLSRLMTVAPFTTSFSFAFMLSIGFLAYLGISASSSIGLKFTFFAGGGLIIATCFGFYVSYLKKIFEKNKAKLQDQNVIELSKAFKNRPPKI